MGLMPRRTRSNSWLGLPRMGTGGRMLPGATSRRAAKDARQNLFGLFVRWRTNNPPRKVVRFTRTPGGRFVNRSTSRWCRVWVDNRRSRCNTLKVFQRLSGRGMLSTVFVPASFDKFPDRTWPLGFFRSGRSPTLGGEYQKLMRYMLFERMGPSGHP